MLLNLQKVAEVKFLHKIKCLEVNYHTYINWDAKEDLTLQVHIYILIKNKVFELLCKLLNIYR